MMKKPITILLLFLLGTCILKAQNLPVFGDVDTIYSFISSGENHFVIPSVSDGDDESQNLDFTAVSSSPNLDVISVEHTTGDKIALLKFEEKGIAGIYKIVIAVTDPDGYYSDSLFVRVGPYNNPGAIFQIHDAVFWQELVPLNLNPIYEQIIPTGEGPYDELNYDEIPLTVNDGCNGDICTGHDFYTAFYKGYFVPPATASYTFFMEGENNFGLWLSNTEVHDVAQNIIYKGGNLPEKGTNIGNHQYQSAPLELQEGVPYAFYATQWIVHQTYGGVLVEGGGIPKSFIPGENMMPYFDSEKPETPGNLTVLNKTSDKILLDWDTSSDNEIVEFYKIYLNGELYKDSTVSSDITLENLSPGTLYNILVTAVDKVGNESLTSEIVRIETWPADAVSPQPPTSLNVLLATGISVKLSWSGASDGETDVVAFNVYLEDSLLNEDDFLYADSLIIFDLKPNTSYDLQVESVDASYNVSDKSEVFTFKTSEYDPFGPDLGDNNARLSIAMQNISWNNGFGLNGPYESGEMVNNPDVVELIREFEAGAIRWGAISANSKSLSGSSGTGKSNTYAKMFALANEIDAYFSLTVGVQDGIDFIENINTFSHLLEYLEGDGNTSWGAKRIAEGFTDPLISSAPKGLFIEFGNEVWGRDAHDAQIGNNYDAYAAWCREAADLMRQSPYYDPDKIRFVYSGRNPHPDDSWGITEPLLEGDSGKISVLGVSGYLGGNLDYDPELPTWNSEIQYYRQKIEQAQRKIEGFRASMIMGMDLSQSIKQFYLYESNATTPSYNGRLGQAMVVVDFFASGMPYGSLVPSIFHLTGGEWRITVPSDNYRPLPLFTAGKFFNQYCKGHILKTKVDSKFMIKDGNGREMDVEPVGAHAYNEGENFAILLVSRDFARDYTVQLDLPDDFTFTPEATMYTFTGESFNDTHVEVDTINIQLEDSIMVKVPAFGMVLISYQGENLELDPLPLGYFDHIEPESIELKPEDDLEYEVDENLERVYFVANLAPEDAFFQNVIIEELDNPVKATFRYLGAGRSYVKGSGKCDGNGTLKLVAWSVENPEIRDTLEVNISNQGSNCNVSVNDHKTGNIWFYPNPAQDRLNIKTETEAWISVYNLSGRLMLNKKIEVNGEINLSDLDKGLYTIELRTVDQVKQSQFIKQ